ncbi:MAG: TolC family protein [Flavobacteriales bacterium]
MNRIITLLISLTLSSSTLFAQQRPAITYTLEQAVAYALKNSYSAKNAQTDVEIARKQVKEVTGVGLPQINADAQYQQFINLPVSLVPANAFDPSAPDDLFLKLAFGTNFNTNYGVSASQLIFSGEYIVGLQAARAVLDMSKLGQKKSDQEITETVSKSYYTVLILKENKRIIEGSIKNIDESLRQTVAFNKEGFVEELDVDRLMLFKNNLINTQNTLIRQSKLAEMLLKFHMGLDVNAEVDFVDKLDETLLKVTMRENEQLQFNPSQNIDALLLSKQVDLQRLQLRRERSNYLPSVAGFFSARENRFGNEFSQLRDEQFRVAGGTIWGLQLNVPIFAGFSKNARVQQARLELFKVENQKEQINQSLAMQAAAAETDFKTALEKYRTAEESVRLAEKIRKIADIKYQEGVGSSIERTQAETDLLNAQSAYMSSVLELLNARVNLDKNLNKF